MYYTLGWGIIIFPTPWGIIYRLHLLQHMVETILSGIVLGLIPVTLSGLFVTAYLQYRRGDQLNL
jgi:cytochrome b6-f complex subunit 5